MNDVNALLIRRAILRCPAYLSIWTEPYLTVRNSHCTFRHLNESDDSPRRGDEVHFPFRRG